MHRLCCYPDGLSKSFVTTIDRVARVDKLGLNSLAVGVDVDVL